MFPSTTIRFVDTDMLLPYNELENNNTLEEGMMAHRSPLAQCLSSYLIKPDLIK